jgi:LysR family transcriptional regulator, glycine cleavage system transcriptional activator
MHELPPLNALKAFDSVARHESVSHAANELCVTPGAITKQIQHLESFLGVPLFIRRHRQIILNEQGKIFQRAVSKALLEIQTATNSIKGSAQNSTLKIRSYTTFSIRWLIPHAPKFLSANPEISLELTTSLDPVDFARDNIDCAIRLGSGDWPNATSTKLIDNVIVPVCSPQYLKGKKMKTPKDLLACNLLHIKRRPNDWNLWFSGIGLSVDSIPQGMMCENSEIAYSAAKEGLGIAMAQYFLVRDDIELGKLVRPVMQSHDCGDNTYYLVMPSNTQQNIHSRKFKEWILSEIEGSKDRP